MQIDSLKNNFQLNVWKGHRPRELLSSSAWGLNVIAASSELKKIAIKVLILYLVSKYLLCKFIVVTVEK